MGLLALLITALYADVLFFGASFFTRDLTIYHYPMKWIVREIVLGGDFPYWNRLYSAGQPLAANPAYEVFYPPQWLTFLPDYNLGFRLHVVVHFFVAAFGAFRFLRSIDVRRPASFIGAVIFVTCGPYVSTINLLPFLFSISWVPWIALYARRWILERRARDFVLAALFLGLQAIICEPTTLLQTWGVLLLYAAFAGWRAGAMRTALTSLMKASGLIATGVCVAAIQFLPAADHARDSVRAIGFRYEIVSKWSFAPMRFLEYLFPNLLGTLEIYWGRVLYEKEAGPFIYSVYLSVVIAALVLAGVTGRVAGRAFTAAVAVPAFCIALGAYTPLLGVLYRSGLLFSIRYPEKFALSASFAMLTYAIIVLDRVLRGESELARRAARICIATSIVAALIFVIGLLPAYPQWFAQVWGMKAAGAASVARTQWLIAVVRGLAFALGLGVLAAEQGRKQIALFVLFLIADLAPLGSQINPRIHRSFFDDAPPLVRQLDLRGSRLVNVAAMQSTAKEFPVYCQGQNGYWSIRNGLWPATTALAGIPTCFEVDVDETQLLQTRAILDIVEAISNRGVYDWVSVLGPMYGAGPVLVYRDPEKELRRFRGDWSAIEPVDIVDTPRYPRYFFASEMVDAADRERLIDMLVRRRWDPRTAFVWGGARPVAEGQVLGARELANTTEIEVESSGDAFLVLASTHHKYWHAAIDGRATAITETNVAFQGVAVPRGRHRIELRYRNPLIAVGGGVTALALVALGLAWKRGGVENGKEAVGA